MKSTDTFMEALKTHVFDVFESSHWIELVIPVENLDVETQKIVCNNVSGRVTALLVEIRRRALKFETTIGYTEVRFEKPETWWDHFKLRYFGTRLLNRFPVKMTSEVIKVKATETRVCPYIRLAKDADYLKWTAFESTDSELTRRS